MHKNLFLFFIAVSLSAYTQTVEDLAELAKAGDQLESILNSQEETNEISGADKSIDNEMTNEDEISNEDLFLDEDENRIFGFDFIRSVPKSISGTSDLPVPNDYTISLGDEIKFILTGGKKGVFSLTVGLDGNIFIPEIGPLNVFGDNLAELRKKVQQIVELSYVGTDVSVSISNLSAKKINIVGAVKKPGTFIINPFSTISTALSYSGGFEPYASLREIIVIRGENRFTFDLYDLLVFGDRSDDINLEQGDTILIQPTNNHIEILGEVNRPLTYEYLETETLDDVIEFSMGLKKNVNMKKIAIQNYNKDFTTTIISEINLSDNLTLSSLNNPISVEFFKTNANSVKKIKVFGELQNPGYFNVPESRRLGDLLNNLVLTDETFMYLGVIQKNNQSNLFSLNDKSTLDLEVSENLEVFLFNRGDVLEIDTIDYTEGELSPNSLKLIEDYMLRVNYSGQTINFPFFGKITSSEVYKFLGLDMSGVYADQTTYLAPLDGIQFVGNYEELEFKASRFNSLSFRNLVDKTISVSINGEVNLPGTYSLSPGLTLHELYRLVNGLNEYADTEVAIFTRKSIQDINTKRLEQSRQSLRETILLADDDANKDILKLLNQGIDNEMLGRISGSFAINTPSNRDFLLEDGDSIFIPKKVLSVSVIGEVLNPLTFIYSDDLNLKNIISEAGGYTKKADRGSIYIIRADGTSEQPAGLFGKSLVINPGDTIVVPTDYLADKNIFESLIPITQTLSNLAFAAAAVENLRN